MIIYYEIYFLENRLILISIFKDRFQISADGCLFIDYLWVDTVSRTTIESLAISSRAFNSQLLDIGISKEGLSCKRYLSPSHKDFIVIGYFLF